MASKTGSSPNPGTKQGLSSTIPTVAVADSPRGIWARLALGIGLGAVGSALAVGVASFPLSSLLIRPRLKRLRQLRSPHLRARIERAGLVVKDVEFTSFDSTRLSGWWLEHSKTSPTVIVVHGVKQNRTDVVRAALLLRRAGFNALLFDGRGHGNSGGKYVTYGFYERRDVEAAIQWLIGEAGVDPGLIGLAGESMGAAISLQVAASNPSIRAVWADSPFASLQRVASEFVQKVTHLPAAVLSPLLWTTLRVANYRGNFDVETVDPLALASKITCPVFMTHGTADQLISVEHSRNIYEKLAGKKELWLVEGAAHARAARFARTEYADRIVRFFKKNLVPREGSKD
ncbi:MAG TPA: alpha/beta fold hydrolase [Blastocatellia bacterium]|nr:alpha/beta fold hydrolase [Blastocatellia bacterium]